MTDQPATRRRDLARAAFDAELAVTGYSLPRYARQRIADAILAAVDADQHKRQRAEATLVRVRKACDDMAFKADALAREAAETSSDALLALATGYGEAARHIARAALDTTA